MRSMLSVRWKLVLAVVGVSFICLFGLMMAFRRQTERYILDRNRELVREAVVLAGARYNLASEKSSNMAAAVSARVIAELEVARERDGEADVERIATYLSIILRRSSIYMRGLAVIVNPGVLHSPGADGERFFDDQGYGIIRLKQTVDGIHFDYPAATGSASTIPWWRENRGSTTAMIMEPYLAFHETPSGGAEHIETRFIYPIHQDGVNLGMVAVEICLTAFQRTYLQADSGSPFAMPSILVSSGGALIGVPHNDNLAGLATVSSSGGIPHLRLDAFPEIHMALETDKFLDKIIMLNGRRVLISLAPIGEQFIADLWSVLMVQPEAEMLDSAATTFDEQYYAALVMALVSIAFGFVVSKSMGKALTRAEEWHRTIFDRMPIPMGLVDRESRWVYANPAIAEVLDAPDSASLVGSLCRDTMPQRDAEFVVATNHPEAHDVETLELPVSGNRMHLVSSCRILDADQTYLGRLIIGVDITDTRSIVQTLRQVAAIAKSLDGRSERVLSVAHSLSGAAMEQSAAIEEITSTTQKIGESSAEYAASAKQSHENAQFTFTASGRGAEQARSAVGAMTGVKDSGLKITGIIQLIDGIAFQTNLLALNAAVEAARAGRHGKGFAVVADEVRNLSQRSAKAARETASIIEEMTERIGEAADSIERLGETLAEIRSNGESLSANSDQVARLAELQTQSVKQVHLSLEQISQSVNATITISREAATVAESIFQQAASLRTLTRATPGSESDAKPVFTSQVFDLSRYRADDMRQFPQEPTTKPGGTQL